MGLLTFRDSYQHMNHSLSKLVDTLRQDDFVHTRNYWERKIKFGNVSEVVKLITRKGILNFLFLYSENSLKNITLKACTHTNTQTLWLDTTRQSYLKESLSTVN